MAATAHSDPYAIFMRKVGYSVGLEHTLQRVGDLQKLYASSKDLTTASWMDLVTGSSQWGLRSDENIKDVFYSLRLVQRTLGDILILENLDAMTIAVEMLKSEEERDRARAFLLLWAIVTNDGEIFVNLLLAEFDEPRIKRNLSRMIARKRSDLSKVLPGKDSYRRICRTVTIERQENNRGSIGNMRSIASLRRTAPLQKEISIARFAKSDLGKVEFSEDYFRKVPPRRKDWARTLGLWDDKCGLTQRGRGFVDRLKRTGYILRENIFIFWPMDYELVRSRFRPNLLESVKRLWDCVIDVGTAYADVDVRPRSLVDPDEAVELVDKMMKVFRSLHTRKSMLRREIPITVVYPAVMALAAARGKPVLDLDGALRNERQGEHRRIAFRQSRNVGGALSLKK